MATCIRPKNIAKILALIRSISSFNSVIAYLWQVTNYANWESYNILCLFYEGQHEEKVSKPIFLETKLILLSKLTNTEKLLMCIKYSEAKVSETCPFEIIFLYKSLKYCALGTTGIQEHPFHTDLKYAMYSLLYQPKLNFRFLHLNQKEKNIKKLYPYMFVLE